MKKVRVITIIIIAIFTISALALFLIPKQKLAPGESYHVEKITWDEFVADNSFEGLLNKFLVLSGIVGLLSVPVFAIVKAIMNIFKKPDPPVKEDDYYYKR